MEIRFVKAHEMKAAIEKADRIFRDSEQSSMGTAFPKIFSSSIRHSFGAFEDNEVVAFMGLVPNVIRVGESKLHVYCLGSVYTVPESQGKGYASLLLNEVEAFIRQSGASLLLVSGSRSLYTRAGCLLFGQVRCYTITAADFRVVQTIIEHSKVQYRLFQETDWVQFYQLAKSKKTDYDSSMHDLAQVIESECYASEIHLKHEVHVAELEGMLVAAVIMVRQEEKTDFAVEPYIVDWYGIASAAASLIAHILGEYSISQTHLRSPWHEADLHQVLEGMSYTTLQNAGTVKVMNYPKLWQQILPHLQEKDKKATDVIHLIHNDDDSECVHLSILGQVFSLSHEEFTALLFDPGANIPSLASQQPLLNRIFPISFPDTSGLHSI